MSIAYKSHQEAADARITNFTSEPILLLKSTTQTNHHTENSTFADGCHSPKLHLGIECFILVLCNVGQQRYISIPKLLKLKANEFWRRTRIFYSHLG
jgi:hypothetical protein